MFTSLWAATQRDRDRLEERANSSLMTFNKDKCKSCTSDRLNPYTVQAGASLAGSNSPGRDLVSSRLQTSQHHALGAMKVNSVLGCVNRTIAGRSSKVIIPLYSALIRLHLEPSF
ncbi:hypothetical protein QYF61_003080 [Mycteria americana]|uniref:Uncharacterized protein n=1 Tax=Mycteria americana TaxID=33587 RepID=A0AAN7NQN7_MYCAM|nr:hypothetical protein QYF61_003080 [Mycteria americana]